MQIIWAIGLIRGYCGFTLQCSQLAKVICWRLSHPIMDMSEKGNSESPKQYIRRRRITAPHNTTMPVATSLVQKQAHFRLYSTGPYLWISLFHYIVMLKSPHGKRGVLKTNGMDECGPLCTRCWHSVIFHCFPHRHSHPIGNLHGCGTCRWYIGKVFKPSLVQTPPQLKSQYRPRSIQCDIETRRAQGPQSHRSTSSGSAGDSTWRTV